MSIPLPASLREEVARVVKLATAERSTALEALCRRHPDWRSEIRARARWLGGERGDMRHALDELQS